MNKNASIVYFLTRSFFLGFGISMLLYQSGKDVYFGAILGVLLGLIITYFYNSIISNKKEKDLKYLYKNNKIIGRIAQVLMFLASYIILIYSLILYTVFVISFLLINSPVLYVIIPFLIIGFYLAFKSLKIISRVASILLPISVIFSIISFLGLGGFFEVTNFLPILTNSPTSFFKTAFSFAGISVFPNILTLHFHDDTKNNMKIYILASIIIIITCICINGVLGQALTQIFRFPEYMVLKQLQAFKFIEKVENIFSNIWIFDLFITVVMAIYSIKESIPTKNNKLITVLILVITVFLINKIFVFNYVNELKLYYILPYLALFLSIMIIFPFKYLIKKTN